LLCVGLVTAFLIAIADVAQASLFLQFDRTRGRPGTIVRVHTMGEGACAVCPHRLRLSFARAKVAGDITSPEDPRLVRVGFLIVDDRGNGSGTLTVPRVPSGRYVVMTYCKPCAPGSGGRAMLPLGPDPPFRVSGGCGERSGEPGFRPEAGAIVKLLTRRSIGR
jgi:hypothetical protein